MTDRGSLPRQYFERLYSADPDPWRFATSGYEAAKYAATVAALPRPRYASGLEIGCSIGILTEQLARRCDHLLAVDTALSALDAARGRLAQATHVEFACMQVPDELPSGSFDLLMLSEVLYYFDLADLRRLADYARGSVSPRGTILLVHWLHDAPYPLSGDDAAGAFIRELAADIDILHQARTLDYRLDLLERR